MDSDSGKAPPAKADPPGEHDEGDRDWVEVRESWVGDGPTEAVQVEPYVAAVLPPPPNPPERRPLSAPPPLPPSAWPAATLSTGAYEAFAIAAARAPDTSGAMLDRLAASDYDGALRAAECVLRATPDDVEALQCRDLCRSELRLLYVARLGDLARVPALVAGGALLRVVDVDLRAGLVVARVDGRTSLAEIARHGVVPELEALRILSELVLSGVIACDESRGEVRFATSETP